MKKIIGASVALATLLAASPAAAFGGFHFPQSSSDINIDVDSSAYVKNEVTTVADTGGNTSVGGEARNYVRGGNVDDTTANGGDTGDIDTGDALSTSIVDNSVNLNEVKVKADCGCKGDIDIDVDNRATVKNYVTTVADTGGNTSVGGEAKNKVKAKSSSNHYWWHQGGSNVDDTTANGGDTGDIDTGDADAYSQVTNLVNTNVVRVRR